MYIGSCERHHVTDRPRLHLDTLSMHWLARIERLLYYSDRLQSIISLHLPSLPVQYMNTLRPFKSSTLSLKNLAVSENCHRAINMLVWYQLLTNITYCSGHRIDGCYCSSLRGFDFERTNIYFVMIPNI
jgi:hypothetical protein